MKKTFPLRAYYIRARIFGFVLVFFFVFYLVHFILEFFNA